MDLNQRKLIKSEWDSIEVPFSQSEINVLKLIISGFHNVNIKMNSNDSLFTFLKIEYNLKMEDYIYNKYLREIVEKIIEKYKQITNSNDNDILKFKINVLFKLEFQTRFSII